MHRIVHHCLLAMALIIGGALHANDDFRILSLLPNIENPPLVEPYLPSSFSLGRQNHDVDYENGYYWGNPKTLTDYFNEDSALNGCIIRAQIAHNVTQTGFDRFSSDGKPNNLTAAGFTEITVNKGKWGIFPYREMQAKGPKGRHYFQMWVGLNDEKGSTIYFQLLYPDYLNEPTQSQRKIWKDFVKKTSFLSLQDLITIREMDAADPLKEHVSFTVEKRRIDSKFFIQLKPAHGAKVTVLGVKDCNSLKGYFEKPYLEITLSLKTAKGSTLKETARVNYSMVDHFSYPVGALSKKAIEIHKDYLLLQR